MTPVLAIVLVVRLALFPELPPIHVERFESERECHRAAALLDQSTPLVLILTCEIDV